MKWEKLSFMSAVLIQGQIFSDPLRYFQIALNEAFNVTLGSIESKAVKSDCQDRQVNTRLLVRIDLE